MTNTLAAARYQMVPTDVPPPALAPMIERMNLLKARAMSSARLILRTGAARAIQPGEAVDAQDAATALRASQGRTMQSVVRPDGTRGTEPMDLARLRSLRLSLVTSTCGRVISAFGSLMSRRMA